MWEGQKFNRLRQFGLDRTQKSTVQGLIFHWPDSHGQGELMGLFHPCTLVGTSAQERGIVPQGSSAPRPVTSRDPAVGSTVLQSQGLLGEAGAALQKQRSRFMLGFPVKWEWGSEGQMQTPRMCNTGRAILTQEIQIDHTSHLFLRRR